MNIQISNVAIRQTNNKLFNLNGLHKASGSEIRHKVNNKSSYKISYGKT